MRDIKKITKEKDEVNKHENGGIIGFSSRCFAIGKIHVAGNRRGITDISIGGDKQGFLRRLRERHGHRAIIEKADYRAVFKMLDEYFKGKRTRFDLRVNLIGRPFDVSIWKALIKIPYGRAVSYEDAARMSGHLGAQRAVGSACGRNPVSIIVPCHRVIRKDKGLGGYTGGLEIKKTLLELEGNMET
ncbi:MAG: methylated-DNA--[protein]-cysteine S-methyltransferase [Deltaproteobacteria bacterium]|nr:methylated-DNA--[protein]-cysteine S-methyltransferase [Deltaproteobacteria bacterium]